MKQKILIFIKLSLVICLLFFLSKKGLISIQATQQALSQWKKILPAVTLLLLTSTLSVFRWQWLLEAQNIRLSWSRVFQLSMIGNFFNIALPGAVSGDFIKAFYIGKELQGQRGRALGSILFDRLAGVSALVLVSGGALAIGFRSYLHSPLLNAVRVLILIAATAVLFFYGYLFLIQEHHDPVLQILKKIEKRFAKTGSLTRIYEGIRHYHHHRKTVIKVLAISILVHLTVGWCCLNFAQALGESHLSLLPLYIVFPLGLLVTAIPVAPAGMGTGNIAFFYFFHLIGSERGADIFSLLALSNLFIGGIGGLVYFRFRTHEKI